MTDQHARVTAFLVLLSFGLFAGCRATKAPLSWSSLGGRQDTVSTVGESEAGDTAAQLALASSSAKVSQVAASPPTYSSEEYAAAAAARSDSPVAAKPREACSSSCCSR